MQSIAIYPGSFDPITNGHTDLVQRAAKMFDKLIFAIGINAKKQPLFSIDERIELSKAVLADIPNVEVTSFESLMVDYAAEVGAQVIVRGLRAVSDYEFELQLANTNRRLDHSIDTIFLTPAEEHSFISSTLVKEIARYRGDVSSFCHPVIEQALLARLHQ
ncbi:MAG: pantetheine-phosphate adenylyltransferase [Gammaproteobacteria bacterium]|nr:MAG: pantetheine-phosphate adenylyltransferase [Gammaproteobacteria bacterium]